MNNIEDISNFIFVGKKFEELTKYDLLIINTDFAEKKVADDLYKMFKSNIIDSNTTFLICDGHSDNQTNSADTLIKYIKEYKLENEIIIDREYIINPELLKNINKIVDINKYNSILRVAKSFITRRWYMNAKRHNFPIENVISMG